MAQASNTKAQSPSNMSAAVPNTATDKTSSAKMQEVPLLATQQVDSDDDLDRDFPPIEPLPTPPKKKALTANESGFAVALLKKRKNKAASTSRQAPGLGPNHVNSAAMDNPPERPANERINKVFQEQVKNDTPSEGEAVTGSFSRQASG